MRLDRKYDSTSAELADLELHGIESDAAVSPSKVITPAAPGPSALQDVPPRIARIIAWLSSRQTLMS